jgi:hypothetical protein
MRFDPKRRAPTGIRDVLVLAGSFTRGVDGAHVEIDTLDFIRTLPPG